MAGRFRRLGPPADPGIAFVRSIQNETSWYAGAMTAMAPPGTSRPVVPAGPRQPRLRTQMAAALAEMGLTPRMHCVLVHALERSGPRSSSPRSATWTRRRWWSPSTPWRRRDWRSADRPARTGGPASSRSPRRVREVAARSQEIVDGVHRAALDALPGGEREVLVRAMNRPGRRATSPTPVEAPRPVRRARAAEIVS